MAHYSLTKGALSATKTPCDTFPNLLLVSLAVRWVYSLSNTFQLLVGSTVHDPGSHPALSASKACAWKGLVPAETILVLL